jgi:hypothetical protein
VAEFIKSKLEKCHYIDNCFAYAHTGVAVCPDDYNIKKMGSVNGRNNVIIIGENVRLNQVHFNSLSELRGV